MIQICYLIPYSETAITKTKTVNICMMEGITTERKVYALASPVRGGTAASSNDCLHINVL